MITAALEDVAPQRPKTVWDWVCSNRRCHMPGAGAHAARVEERGVEYRCFRCNHRMRSSKVTPMRAHKGRNGYSLAQIEALSEKALAVCGWQPTDRVDCDTRSKAPAKSQGKQLTEHRGRPAGPKTVGGRSGERRNKPKAGVITL